MPKLVLTPITDSTLISPSHNHLGDSKGKGKFFDFDFSYNKSDDYSLGVETPQKISNNNSFVWIKAEDVSKEQNFKIRLDALSPDEQSLERIMPIIKEEDCNDDSFQNFVSYACNKIEEINSRQTPKTPCKSEQPSCQIEEQLNQSILSIQQQSKASFQDSNKMSAIEQKHVSSQPSYYSCKLPSHQINEEQKLNYTETSIIKMETFHEFDSFIKNLHDDRMQATSRQKPFQYFEIEYIKHQMSKEEAGTQIYKINTESDSQTYVQRINRPSDTSQNFSQTSIRKIETHSEASTPFGKINKQESDNYFVKVENEIQSVNEGEQFSLQCALEYLKDMNNSNRSSRIVDSEIKSDNSKSYKIFIDDSFEEVKHEQANK